MSSRAVHGERERVLTAEFRPSETPSKMNVLTQPFKPPHSNILLQFSSYSRCQMLGTKYDMQQNANPRSKVLLFGRRQAIWGKIPGTECTVAESTSMCQLVRPL